MRATALLLSVCLSAASEDDSATEFDFWSENSNVANSSFAGRICEGLSPSTPASQLLVGRHLLLDEMAWWPFAIRDENVPGGFTGLDMDLLYLIAGRLGFTWTVQDMGAKWSNESYTDMLFRRVVEADVVMSYWTHTASRREQVTEHTTYTLSHALSAAPADRLDASTVA